MTDGIAKIKSTRPHWMDGAAEAGNYYPEPEYIAPPLDAKGKLIVLAIFLASAGTSLSILAVVYGWAYRTFFN